MDSWHAYPKVYALGHKATLSIFDGPVTVEEKIDGSQFSFGVIDGRVKCKSKNQDQDPQAPDKMFIPAIETVLEISDRLTPEWTYRSEYLRTPKHNTLTYSRIPKRHIIIFDINNGNECYLSHEQKIEEAERIGLEVVPRLDLVGHDLESLKGLLETDSCLGGTKIEGFVVKNYERFTIEGKAVMGKFVSEGFKETNKQNWKKASNKDVVALIIDEYKTEARWEKAIQSLRDDGRLDGSPRDIGELIKVVCHDVHEECGQEIGDRLFKVFWKQIHSGLTRGLPEWYKGKLLEAVAQPVSKGGVSE